MSVTLSSKYQIVIPKSIRDSLKLKPGCRLDFIDDGSGIRLVAVRPIKEARGMAKGRPFHFEREESDRL